MNIVSHLHQIALEKVAETLLDWKEFLLAKPSVITTTKAKLSDEIVKLGGKLEYWKAEDSGEYFLIFGKENPLCHGLIGKHDDAMFFHSNIGNEQYIIRASAEEISIVSLGDVPMEIMTQLEKLAMENIAHATIERG